MDIKDVLQERGDKYGSFHTHANLSQTLSTLIKQHYAQTHVDKEGKVIPLPEFMLEAINMICHKLARIANGNPFYDDSWVDIGGYSQLVVDILQQATNAMPKQEEAPQPVNDDNKEGNA
jgi:hypothetical protein